MGADLDGWVRAVAELARVPAAGLPSLGELAEPVMVISVSGVRCSVVPLALEGTAGRGTACNL